MNRNPLTFRTATANDSATVAALHTASWRNAYRGMLPDSYLDQDIDDERLQIWQGRLNRPEPQRQYVLLAELEQQAIGFVCVLLDEEPAWGACLDNLHMHPDHKRSGIGRQLFAHATDWVIASEPTWPLHLLVFEANQDARRFYDTYNGQVAERMIKHMPGGVALPVLRYIWRDLGGLLAALRRTKNREPRTEN